MQNAGVRVFDHLLKVNCGDGQVVQGQAGPVLPINHLLDVLHAVCRGFPLCVHRLKQSTRKHIVTCTSPERFIFNNVCTSEWRKPERQAPHVRVAVAIACAKHEVLLADRLAGSCNSKAIACLHIRIKQHVHSASSKAQLLMRAPLKSTAYRMQTTTI